MISRIACATTLCLVCVAVNAEPTDVLTVHTALRSEAAVVAVCNEYDTRKSIYADLARQMAQQREQLGFAVGQNNPAEIRHIEKQIEILSAHLALARNSVDFYALKSFIHDIELRDASAYLHFYLRDRRAPPLPAVHVSVAAPTVAEVIVDVLGDRADAASGTSALAVHVRFWPAGGEPYWFSASARALTFVPTARVSGKVGALCSALSADAPILEVRTDFAMDWPRLATQTVHYIAAADSNAEEIRRNDLVGRILLFEGLTKFLERMLVDRSYRLVQDIAFYDKPSFVPMSASDLDNRVGGPRLLTPGGRSSKQPAYEYETLFNVFDGVAAEFGSASVVLTKQDLIALRDDLANSMRLDGNTLLLTWAKSGKILELCFRREPDGLRLSCVRMNGISKWPLRQSGE